MVKVIGIIENNSVTGVQYGEIEVPETSTKIKHAQKQYAKICAKKSQKVRSERTKSK